MSQCTEKLCDNYDNGECEIGCTPDVPARIEQLEGVIRKYGRHGDMCDIHLVKPSSGRSENLPCNCGFDQVLGDLTKVKL